MGFIETADIMVDNSMKMMQGVLESKFTPFLQGNGTPVLVTYYNIDDVMSTTDHGTYTIDEMTGDCSPLRYNKILNFPVYGLREIIPSKEVVDGGLVDLSFEGEIIILPNTIKPNGLDYLVYEYPNGYSLTFQVTDFEFSTIKNNNYYKLSIRLKDVDNSTVAALKIVEVFRANLEKIGTTDACIIKSTRYDELVSLQKIKDYLIQQYIDLFYERKYNCLMFRGDDRFNGYALYDQFIHKFVIDHALLDRSNEFITLVNYENKTNKQFSKYNKTIYRNIELQDMTHLHNPHVVPIKFSKSVLNPFAYFGEESMFTTGLCEEVSQDEYVDQLYMPVTFTNYLNDIVDDVDPMEVYPLYWRLIKRYLKKSDNLFELIPESEINELCNTELEYTDYYFKCTPMVLYILNRYMKYLNNNK